MKQKLVFDKIDPLCTEVDIDFGNGEGFTRYTSNNLTKNGITIPDDCNDFNDIKIKNVTNKSVKNIYYNISSVSETTINKIRNNPKIRKVKILGAIEKIPEDAFLNCTNIEEITILSNIKYIEKNAFKGCSNLVNIKIPETLLIIEESAFESCTKLENFKVPKNIEYIGDNAFADCTSLAEINIPNDISFIGKNAFNNDNVSIKFNGPNYEWDNIYKKELNETGNITIDSLQSYTLTAFNDANQSIINNAKHIKVMDGITEIPEATFKNNKIIESIYLPNSVTSIGKEAFLGCTNLKFILFSDNLTSIGESAFRGCWSLFGIDLPNSLTSIGKYAFYNCTDIQSIITPDTTESIGESAFAACSALQSAICKGTFTTLPKNIFRNCANLTEVYLTNNIETIEEDVLNGCEDLIGIYYSGTSTEYGNINNNSYFSGILYDEYNLANYYITKFNTKSYNYLTNNTINNIKIENSKIVIPDGYFANSTSTAIDIALSTYMIGKEAFKNSSINNFDFYKNIEKIQENAFDNCTSLTNVILPYNLKKLDNKVFANCTNLQNVIFQKNITAISDSAFENCNNLTEISYTGSSNEWDSSISSLVPTEYNKELAYRVTNSNELKGSIAAKLSLLSITKLIFDGSITEIPANTVTPAFSNLEYIVFDEGIQNIYAEAIVVNENFTGTVVLPKSLRLLYPFYKQIDSTTNGVISYKPLYTQYNGTSVDWQQITTFLPSSLNQSYNKYYCTSSATSSIPSRYSIVAFGQDHLIYCDCSAVSTAILSNKITSLENFGFSDSLKTVNYRGTEEEWNSLVQTTNFNFAGITINYNYRESFYYNGGYNINTISTSIIPLFIDDLYINVNYNESIDNSNLNIYISENVEYFPDIINCKSLAISPDNPYITYENGILYTNNKTGISKVYGQNLDIIIPSTVEAINTNAFDTCTVNTITVADGNEIFVAENNILFNIDKTFIYYIFGNLDSFVIPNTVEDLGTKALSYCTMNTITAPYNMIINYCKDIPNIIISDEPTFIGNSDFQNCRNLTSIVIPDSVTDIGNFAFSGCYKLTTITIPNTITSIKDSTFSGCSSLTSIIIPEGVTSIGSSAFSGCSSLTSIIILEGVTSIGSSAFSGCSNLTLIAIPESVTSIGSNAFYNCTSLTSISIPNSANISYNIFSGCSNLISINTNNNNHLTLENNILYYNNEYDERFIVFGRVSSDSNVFTIPNTVQGIGAIYFSENIDTIETPYDICNSEYFNNIPNIIISDNNTDSIGYELFGNHTNLRSIIIPSSITRIGSDAFYDCINLLSINIPEGVTSIGNSAFYNCSSLTSITIPDSVTFIGDYAFRYCRSLTSIVLPSSIENISTGCFRNCGSLTSITIPASVTRIENNAFIGCNNLTIIYQGSEYEWSNISKGNQSIPSSAIITFSPNV